MHIIIDKNGERLLSRRSAIIYGCYVGRDYPPRPPRASLVRVSSPAGDFRATSGLLGPEVARAEANECRDYTNNNTITRPDIELRCARRVEHVHTRCAYE